MSDSKNDLTQAKTEATAGDRKSFRLPKYFHAPENWVSLLTLLSVMIYTVITLKQCGISKRQEHISEKQLEAYVGVPANSIEVQCKKCDLAMNISTPKKPTPVMFDDGVSYAMKNFGSTPAYHRTICEGYQFYSPQDSFDSSNVDKTLAKCKIPPQSPAIWPGEARPYGMNLDPKNLMLARKGWSFVFYGAVSFTDVLNARQSTDFCFMYFFEQIGQSSIEGFRGCDLDSMKHGVGLLKH